VSWGGVSGLGLAIVKVPTRTEDLGANDLPFTGLFRCYVGKGCTKDVVS